MPKLVIRKRAMMLRLVLLTGVVADGLCMVAFGSNLHALWSVLLVASGIYIGLLTIDGNGRVAVVLCALGLVSVPIALLARALPIHTFDCTYLDRVDKIVIDSAPAGGEIVLTDSRSIAEFRSLVGRGSYQTSLKCGECYGIALCEGANRSNYVLLYDSLGRLGGGTCQTAFVPRDRTAFRTWLERVLREHVE
jgi:hypothetical protein